MEIGDPKKAMILALVAVAICAFAVMRLLPKPLDTGHAVVKNELAVPAQPDLVLGRQTVLNDPFMHPILLQRQLMADDGDAPKPAPAQGNTKTMAPSEFKGDGKNLGTTPFLPGLGNQEIEPRTGGNTENDQQPKVEVQRTVQLMAVIQVDQPQALLSLEDGSSRKLTVGQTLKGWKVTTITDASITLTKDGATTTLRLGGKINL